MTQSHEPNVRPSVVRRWGIVATILLVAIGIAACFQPGIARRVIRSVTKGGVFGGNASVPEKHDDHNHDHGHSHSSSASGTVVLSSEALKNLGLDSTTVKPVELSNYQKTISVPGIVAERPGMTTIEISTPMTGVVTEIAAVEGAAVGPAERLFQIRLTHEDLVQTQTDFVRSLGELDIEHREIKRLEAGAESGAISGKSLLERRYAKEKLEALIQAQREALRLHGLSLRQIEQMSKDRRLLSELSILSPSLNSAEEELQLTHGERTEAIAFIEDRQEPQEQETPTAPAAPATLATPVVPLVVESLRVRRGQSVEQGDALCTLANYERLFIEGHAFEQDVALIHQAVSENWPITAQLAGGETISGLSLSFVMNEIDSQTRTLKFYVDLKNEILRDHRQPEGQRFLTWRYKPGQRVELRVPVQVLEGQIVLPLDAVARDGAESYVYRRTGQGRFRQLSIHELSRDSTSVVVASNGKLRPGDVIAWRSAYQLRQAIRVQSGAAVDPHAGHSH